VRQANLLGPESLQQFTDSQEASLHVFGQSQQLGFHRIIENLDSPFHSAFFIAFLL